MSAMTAWPYALMVKSKRAFFQNLWRGSPQWASARSLYDSFSFLPRRVHYGSGIGVPLLAALLAFVVVAVG